MTSSFLAWLPEWDKDKGPSPITAVPGTLHVLTCVLGDLGCSFSPLPSALTLCMRFCCTETWHWSAQLSLCR